MSLGYLAIGTQQPGLPATEGPCYQLDEHVPPPGRDATLLAVVPIPGTRTSLAIVGYAIRMSGEPEARTRGSRSRTWSRSQLPGC